MVTFEPRYALPWQTDPDLEQLRQVVIERGAEFGEAGFTFANAHRRTSLIAIFHEPIGYYLKYLASLTPPLPEPWLSLGDRSRLAEVVTPDDWEASVGLFIAKEAAWLAIEDFCRTGERSSRISWIQPRDMPRSGNW